MYYQGIPNSQKNNIEKKSGTFGNIQVSSRQIFRSFGIY